MKWRRSTSGRARHGTTGAWPSPRCGTACFARTWCMRRVRRACTSASFPRRGSVSPREVQHGGQRYDIHFHAWKGLRMVSQATNPDWLALTVEEPLEPNLPICDPHHHLWDLRPTRVAPRYLLDEILADVRSGHNVVSTVFIECASMFKPDGPEAMRPVGEVEFVNGIAAMSASGTYGDSTRIAAGIIGTANLRLGDAAAEVLDASIAAGGGRYRGIRLACAR